MEKQYDSQLRITIDKFGLWERIPAARGWRKWGKFAFRAWGQRINSIVVFALLGLVIAAEIDPDEPFPD